MVLHSVAHTQSQDVYLVEENQLILLFWKIKLLSFGAKQRSDEESVSDRNGMEGWLRQTAPSAVKQARYPGCLLLLLLPGFINLLQH